ncbi:cytochrome P450 [Mycolicibacterium phlei]|jgi:cytochrome P450|uniref:Steroid C26-monooxygenase n=1 Tax=Mycolicibacterium phlei DSM 43239 = CCUG 21000 TaxID=1226750 RepID=A0A5N5US39_MYCPH|nr:cytochrome P450 [Mycolicibacterium phlei]VEG09454.1 cytochrome P450 [Mycobacteroides chelonae]AMO61339.1 Biotin biosynthesis cytochrome P450 [Mycolicibacterium phlei]EID14086.1 cytochrome P450 [Mycolicibacterium phlei RIVM601174]KAB7752426.1 cytochrome P450 [Mycolicibacterium phlei DSM 43239 = CCUG 21000]KXW60774.1 cytochrome P450 [Mycolicibacterium phlei DSM 43239 = CCUG 21000]
MTTSVAPSVFDADLPTLGYDLTASPLDILDDVRNAQARAPIAIGPLGPEILSYDLARDILRDNRFRLPPGITLAAQGITSGPLYDKMANSLLGLDGPPHIRLRKLVFKAFTPRSTAGLQDTIREVVNGLVDRVADAGRCDVVTDLARPYPTPIMCALIGAPRQDWHLFADWTEEIFRALNFQPDVNFDESEVMRAWGELDAYVDDMVAARRDKLTDDLLSELIRAESGGDRLTLDELRGLVAGFLMAGTDTTRNQLAASVQVLCDHPDQWARLRDQPDLAMQAVEESMRHSPAASIAPRFATEDVEIGGYLFPAGTFVLVNTFAANRDPAIYPDPERFDISRRDVPPILTFGGGAHYCLGANLARRELAEALVVLTQRLSDVRRAGPAPWKSLLGMTGPVTLTIEFTADTRSPAYA